MEVFYDLLFLLLLIIIFTVIVVLLRKKLLFLWKEVTVKEIVFHRILSTTANMFYDQRELLRNEDNRIHFVRLRRVRKKKIRFLLLKERQDLFLYLNDLYNEIEELQDPVLLPLLRQFEELQKVRRVYNSKILLYNQTISVFPTRFLAIKMNLKIKEYFG